MQNIKEILRNIETKYNIKVLQACETGSRAWGFPSPDSDYDIRFIYRHERDWYLSLNNQKDTIEILDGDLDITGWDLRKCLKLLKKSNVPLIERFQSPIEYYSDEDFKESFKKLIREYYSPIASFYHHYSLATKFWEELKDENDIRLKAFFYLVRSLLSCNWIIKNCDVLPMHIDGLMRCINDDLRTYLRGLVALKATVGEKYLHPKDEKLQSVVLSLFDFVESNKNDLPVNNKDFSLLNKFFIQTLNG
jgi:predicted nucleotidyltransferase